MYRVTIVRMLVIDHTSLNCMYVFVMSTVIIIGSTTLRELDVSWNHIGDNGISVITEELQSNKTLTKLNVSVCRFSVKGTVLYNMY